MHDKEFSIEVPENSGKIYKSVLQFNLFTGKADLIPVEVTKEPYEGQVWDIDEGIALAKTGDVSQIIISGFGIFLGEKSERLVIKQRQKSVYEFPMFRLNEVVISSKGVSISSELIEEFCQRGIRLSFLTGGGKPYAMISSPMLSATIISRREQIMAYNDHRGLDFSKTIVRGKIKNQEKLLRYFGKYLKRNSPERYAKVETIARKISQIQMKVKAIKGETVHDIRDILSGIEGISGRLYWAGVKEIVSPKVEFFGRIRQGALDGINALLNYGYGILYSTVWGAVVNAGLDPFAGFLHTDRPGKPSLVLDLVEEFRQPVVDRVAISHINLGEPVQMKYGLLDAETRKAIGEKILERLETNASFEGKNYKLRSIIQLQARNLCAFLRGERDYKCYSFKW